ncbi:hypothetical protein EUX98_g9293 [Antrodiella citrinella]|uniref:F-box domain-containing protein n=1 Tax=Antrodiella citrinella TaxID=2447956 RepID=A0A4S4LVD5_9APHY|nr:hypothetical protein EUX98_g9293 [Antrodiella citrinella]
MSTSPHTAQLTSQCAYAKMPPELWDAVFTHISDKPTLAACTLLSWRALIPAQRHLFRTLDVYDTKRHPAYTVAAFLDLLRALPLPAEIGPNEVVSPVQYVQHLTMMGGGASDVYVSLGADDVAQVLAKLPALRKLELAGILLEPSKTREIHTDAALDVLILCDVRCALRTREVALSDACGLVDTLRLFHSITTLRITSVSSSSPSPDAPLGLAPSLEGLHVGKLVYRPYSLFSRSPEDSALLSRLTSVHFISLKVFPSAHVGPFLRAIGPRLLELELAQGVMECHSVPLALPALTHLTIHERIPDRRYADDVDLLLRYTSPLALPPSLTHLTLTVCIAKMGYDLLFWDDLREFAWATLDGRLVELAGVRSATVGGLGGGERDRRKDLEGAV